MQISDRLKKVASFVTEGNTVADVGTDHGYIPIYLVSKGGVPRAIAMDVNEGPIQRATENIALYGLADKIETRLSDGLCRLHTEDDIDSVVIAGMGGGLVIKILTEGAHVLDSVKELILSPQSEIDQVRRFLEANGYMIEKEDMLIDEDKYYTVMRAVKGAMHYRDEACYRYGQLLLESKNEILHSFLQHGLDNYENILESLRESTTMSAINRCRELEEEIVIIKQGLSYFSS